VKLAFMGSPDFAVPALRALVGAGHEVAVVYAQAPKPAGRGQRETPCPVHKAAMELGIAVRTPKRLRGNDDEATFFAGLGLDCAVVAAYGLILPKAILDAPARGCINIHGSLLPRWRGAAPIQAAILAGDAETGITIMQMDEGLDTGAMLIAEATPIGSLDTATDLHDRLAEMGARLAVRALAEAPVGVGQDEAASTYAPKLSREDARLNFLKPAVALERQIRAFHPWPGSLALLGDVVIKFLAAEVVAGDGVPGEILDDRLTIACGEGALRPTRLQRAGKAVMDAGEFLRGFSIPAGVKFY
jgi:methionyl-tRNA formyltransferase